MHKHTQAWRKSWMSHPAVSGILLILLLGLGLLYSRRLPQPTDDQIEGAVAGAINDLDSPNIMPLNTVGGGHQVIVKNGRVTLTGTVVHEVDRFQAGETARKVPGVKEVSNEMAVWPQVTYTDDNGTVRSMNITSWPFGADDPRKPRPVPIPPIPAVTVSPNFASLQNSTLSISYPDNWKVLDNSDSQILIVPEGGISGKLLYYGVLIESLRRKNPASDFALDDYLTARDQLVPEPLGASNLPYQVSGTVSGRQAYMGDEASSSWPTDERGWLIVVPQTRDSMLAVLCMAPDRPGQPNSEFERLKPVYKTMLNSLNMR